MPLSAEALAALRAPSSSRERYPDWVVTRTERLAPSRRCKPEALDEDGFREYSFLPCVNGCGVDVKICSDYLKQHKNQAVTDHLSVCMAVVEEDRPRKVPRGGVAVSALTDPSKTALIPKLHAQCEERYNAVMEEVRGVKARLDTHEYVFRAVLPSMALPIRDGEQGVLQVRNAITIDCGGDTPTAIVADEADVRLRRAEAEAAAWRRKFEVSERDLVAATAQVKRLRNGRDLKIMQAFHQRETKMLEEADALLQFVQKAFETMFADEASRTGAELREAYQPVLQKETAQSHRRRQHHRKACQKKTAEATDSGSGSE
jgi:hypothetical protein